MAYRHRHDRREMGSFRCEPLTRVVGNGAGLVTVEVEVKNGARRMYYCWALLIPTGRM